MKKNGFGVGLNHIAEVLLGANTEKIRRWNHQQLSTYGIGKDISRSEWLATGRELVRLGLLLQSVEKFSVVEITPEGMAILKQRSPITLTRPIAKTEKRDRRIGEIECDETLFEQLRQLRKRLADERDVPAYIVFSDVALRHMAREYPVTERDFTRINGVGQKKLEEFGSHFLTEIDSFLKSNPRRKFAPISPALTTSSPRSGAPSTRSGMTETVRETMALYKSGKSIDQIAKLRKISANTVTGHLATAIESGEKIDLAALISPEDQQVITEAFEKTTWEALSPAKEILGDRFTYDQLRLCRAAKLGAKNEKQSE